MSKQTCTWCGSPEVEPTPSGGWVCKRCGEAKAFLYDTVDEDLCDILDRHGDPE